MTTSIRVSAHCSKDTQVRISKKVPNGANPDVVIQDGESHELAVYDDYVVSIKEELKPV